MRPDYWSLPDWSLIAAGATRMLEAQFVLSYGGSTMRYQATGVNLLLTLVAGGEQWRSLAACVTAEPEIFFPVSAAARNPVQIAEAKAVCDRCLVRGQCLDFAVRTRQMHGIWGGMTEEERYPVVKADQQRAQDASTAPSAW